MAGGAALFIGGGIDKRGTKGGVAAGRFAGLPAGGDHLLGDLGQALNHRFGPTLVTWTMPGNQHPPPPPLKITPHRK